MNYEKLYAWLENDSRNSTVIRDGNERAAFVKVPYEDDFDFIYMQSQQDPKNYSRKESFAYCGIYNRLDGRLYDLQKPLKDTLPLMDSGKNINSLREEFESAVRTFVENIVDNNTENLRSPFFENEGYQRGLEFYRQHSADYDARDMFFSGLKSDSLRFKCDFNCYRSYGDNEFNESAMIRYLKYPSSFVEEAATFYWQNYQDDMLFQLYKNDIIKERLLSIEQLSDSLWHRTRDIINAVRECENDYVNVTVCKDGNKISFDYPADDLRYYSDQYGINDMFPTDRNEFRNLYGDDSGFTAGEITSIIYNDERIYEAKPLEVNESPVEDEGFQMTM